MLSLVTLPLGSKEGVPHLFKKLPRFIVMSVMVVISLYLWGYGVTVPCRVSRDRHGHRHGEKAYLSGYLTTMTVMTLICAGFLDGGYVFGRRRVP
jgi:hypothetical protein